MLAGKVFGLHLNAEIARQGIQRFVGKRKSRVRNSLFEILFDLFGKILADEFDQFFQVDVGATGKLLERRIGIACQFLQEEFPDFLRHALGGRCRDPEVLFQDPGGLILQDLDQSFFSILQRFVDGFLRLGLDLLFVEICSA